jgi:F-type H+-transporting ATPase subunit c
MKINHKIALSTLLLPALAVAQEHAAAGTSPGVGNLGYLGAAIGLGIAAAGVGYGQSRAASAALDGISRNPASSNKTFLPLLLSLAFMEALVLLTFLVANNIAGK